MRLASGVVCWLRHCSGLGLCWLVLAGVSVPAGIGGAAAWGQAPDADAWSKLAAVNNLDHAGNTPFHLKVAFQLYDLAGKPGETGTVEEWWASPTSKRIVIDAPSSHGDGTMLKDASAAVVRENYLVNQLLDEEVNPVPKVPQGMDGAVTEKKEQFGKSSLTCKMLRAKTRTVSTPPVLCIEPENNEVRFISQNGGIETAVRNSVGKFHDIYVALDVQMSMMGRYAISGKIEALQSIDPAKSEELTSRSVIAGSPGASEQASRPGEVTAGHRVSFVQPVYPPIAKVEHKGGAVLLHAVISKDGSLKELSLIAVSDPMFTDAAIEAVRHWKYSPHLLNGQPTEVDTTIRVNFAIN